MNMFKGIILFCVLATTGISRAENVGEFIDQHSHTQTIDTKE